MSHANAWILNNLSNKDRCERILSGFGESWRYVYAHLAGLCRRRVILDFLGEQDTPSNCSGECCDVCQNKVEVCNHKEELKVLMHLIKLAARGR